MPAIIYVAPPVRHPRRGGILAVADIIESDERLFIAESVQWTAESCDAVVSVPELCFGTSPDPGGSKDFAGLSDAFSSDVFAGYAGSQCWIHGEDFVERSRRTLADGEGLFIETQAVAWFVDIAAAATVVTSFGGAISAADNFADANYPGRPTLWMNRGDAVEAHGARLLNGDREGNLWTPNGTPVIATSAVPAGTVYVTGSVTVWRTKVVDGTAIDHTHNLEYGIAERGYAVGLDCLVPTAFTVTP